MLTPQELLTKIHETGIFAENWADFSTKKARIEKIRLYREQFRQINRQLKEAEDIVKATFDGRDKVQAVVEKLNLAPYSLIRDLLENLGIGLKKIEVDETSSLPQYGDVIYGDLEEGYWAIGDLLSSQKWQIKHLAQKTKNIIDFAETHLKINQAIVNQLWDIYFVGIILVISIVALLFALLTQDLSNDRSASLYVMIVGISTIVGFLSFFYLIFRYFQRESARSKTLELQKQINIAKGELVKLRDLFRKLS